MTPRLLALLVTLALCSVPCGAAAQGSDSPISAGALLGYGLDLEPERTNPWGFGLGVNAGYTLDIQVYLGARFVYYFGEDDANVWEFGAEPGYAIELGQLTIRPEFGVGILRSGSIGPSTATGGVTTMGASTSAVDLFIAPGGALLYDVSGGIFLGLSARLQFVFADPDTLKALLLLANGGVRF